MCFVHTIFAVTGTNVGSERADKIAIDFLEPENLKDQFCFRTKQALDLLEYIGNESVIL